MEEQSVEVYAPMAIFSSLNDEQRDFASLIINVIMGGNLDAALELITFDGFGEQVLPPLEHSILKRIVLRLQGRTQPQDHLDQVDMDARHLTLLGDNITEDTLRQFYMSVYTTNFHHISIKLKRHMLSRMHYIIVRQDILEQRIEDIDIVTYNPIKLMALILIFFAAMMCFLTVIDP